MRWRQCATCPWRGLQNITKLSKQSCAMACRTNEPIRHKLEIGEKLGAVHRETPAVPCNVIWRPGSADCPQTLDRDYKARTRTAQRTDRARSQLLHQLRLLNIAWGQATTHLGRRAPSTSIAVPVAVEFIVELIEANVWATPLKLLQPLCVIRG